MFVSDETGCNTSQKSDDRIGNKKFIYGKETTLRKSISTIDGCFTTLDITSLNKAHSYVSSFLALKIWERYKATGVDIHVEEIGEDHKPNYI